MYWQNPFLQLQNFFIRDFKNKNVEKSAASAWKTLKPEITKIPVKIAAAVDPARGYRAKLLRSPERVMVGLADSFRQSARIRDFGLSEAINQAYVTDFRFLLVLTLVLVLVIGGSIWWNFLPRKIFNQPKTICSPECLHAIQGKNEKSEVSLSSWDEIFEMFKEDKFLDPLKLVPDNKTRALAIFVSVILLI